MNKKMLLGFVSLLAASLLVAQSLVDISKQEKERREKLKGKIGRVITNADLQAMSKRPAMTVKSEGAAKPTARGQAGTAAAQEVGAVAETETQPEQPQGQAEAAPAYAVEVLGDSFLVKNPELALGAPDGRYAEISVTGVLDLDLQVGNGPGDDIAIYARRPDVKVPEAEKENQIEVPEAAMWWGDFRYAVLGLTQNGEWQEIGIGSGNYPDRFDLGSLSSIQSIRIMFKTYGNPYNQGVNPLRLTRGEFTFGVDAVEALH